MNADIDGRDQRRWLPTFTDYLFVSFKTATAFSPTDFPPASDMSEGADYWLGLDLRHAPEPLPDLALADGQSLDDVPLGLRFLGDT
jgi:hypothetical protein